MPRDLSNLNPVALFSAFFVVFIVNQVLLLRPVTFTASNATATSKMRTHLELINVRGAHLVSFGDFGNRHAIPAFRAHLFLNAIRFFPLRRVLAARAGALPDVLARG